MAPSNLALVYILQTRIDFGTTRRRRQQRQAQGIGIEQQKLSLPGNLVRVNDDFLAPREHLSQGVPVDAEIRQSNLASETLFAVLLIITLHLRRRLPALQRLK